MEYTRLGCTGLQVSRLCLGTMTFGREIDETESHNLLDHFVAAGGNFVDTADAYGAGRSEEIVGSWLQNKTRDDIVLATKVRFGAGLNRRGLGRKHILRSVDESLRRLGADYIDLYQVHMWDYGTPIEETLSTLDSLVASGKVRYLGISNVAGWQLQRTIDTCRAMGWERIVSLQPLYNLLDREAEWELVPVCHNEGVGVIPWSPLRGGWLTGKFRRGDRPAVGESRIGDTTSSDPAWTEAWSNYDNERTWAVIDALLLVAEKIDRTPAQVALNWLLGRPGVTAPILGVRSQTQLDDNLGAVGWELDESSRSRLDEASKRQAPYPYALLEDLRDV
ncbi:aldo/keto reductase [Micromonospora sp. PLK6-60]|uniref:aldo/keto reductase n=1 Tax=Micromonospora sp. PLK6-60 TaxID=2873383 RepID=UPI001CA7A7B8|nr:aldo/keto reductase [Micromonospora sp. PLK6-60]MBY8872039.1 aldo/keto reductase [Micromonospora sp. PLK6-60]